MKFKRIITIIGFLLAVLVSYGQSSDCPAYCLFNTSTFTFTPSNAGVQELNATNRGCLGIEHRSVWLQVNILTGGTMVFRINPNVNSDDFDFAVWGTSPACPPTTAPLRCSYAAGGGNTGVGNGALDLSEDVFGDRWVMAMTVNSGESYIILVDNFSANSGFNLNWNWGAYNTTATFSCSILPIELLSFEGVATDTGNLLKWSCATEINNDRFEIERSTDGINWTVIGTVNGAGNSHTTTNYSFVDNKYQRGFNYYRFRQVDFNGVFDYSGIIVVNNPAAPVKEILKITDVLGREVQLTEPGLKIIIYKDGTTSKQY
jgi:hypothetical protein